MRKFLGKMEAGCNGGWTARQPCVFTPRSKKSSQVKARRTLKRSEVQLGPSDSGHGVLTLRTGGINLIGGVGLERQTAV